MLVRRCGGPSGSGRRGALASDCGSCRLRSAQRSPQKPGCDAAAPRPAVGGAAGAVAAAGAAPA
eukprot:5708137-Lingulodinium_polyedra.AAC.1